MKIVLSLIALAATAMVSVSAHAQAVEKKAASGVAKTETSVDKGLDKAGLTNQGLYAELGLSLLSYKISGTGIAGRPIMLRAIAGYDFHPNLALEAMLGLGLRGASGMGPHGAYSVSAGTMIGAYAKPRLQVGRTLEVFGRVGLTNTSSSVRGYAGTDGGAGLSYGAGFSFKPGWTSFGNREIAINGDFMSYYSHRGVKYSGLTLGAGMAF